MNLLVIANNCHLNWLILFWVRQKIKILRNFNPTQPLSRDRVADFLMLSTVIITNRGCTSLVIRYSDVRLGSINNSGDDEASAYFFPLNWACMQEFSEIWLSGKFVYQLPSCIPTTIIVRSIIHPILPTPPLQGELCLKGTLKSISTLWFKHDKSGITNVQS